MKNIEVNGAKVKISECGEIIIVDGVKRKLSNERKVDNCYKVLKIKGKNYLVHRLVGLVYLENPNNKPCINHIDGNKSNNHYTNLEWCTKKENSQHAYNTGLMNGFKYTKTTKGEQIGISKLKEYEVKDIRYLYSTNNYSQRKLAKMYNVERKTIYCIVNNKTWKHV